MQLELLTTQVLVEVNLTIRKSTNCQGRALWIEFIV